MLIRLVCEVASCLWVSFLSYITLHLPSLWVLLPLPSLDPSPSLWTQFQCVIWSPCNGRVIGTLPWLVGNLGELCTGAICNIFSKLNFLLFLSRSHFLLPLERLTQMVFFFSHPVSDLCSDFPFLSLSFSALSSCSILLFSFSVPP